MNKNFDVIIVGGGMVGAACAVAMAKQQRSVALVETQLPDVKALEKAPLRVSAVNLFSERFLTELGIWSNIPTSSSNQFKRLAASEDGVAPLMFTADEIAESHLGHLIRNEALQLAAFAEIEKTTDAITVFSSPIKSLVAKEDSVALSFEDDAGTQIEASLLVGADGANSSVRKMSKIGTTGWQYQQSCLSITIEADHFEQDITWQQFQPSGPKAFLPLTLGHHALIWYDDARKIKALNALPHSQLKQKITETFPELPGDFNIVQHAAFPLTRMQANQYVKGRVVLVGDAAHTINPLAGQGVNLGYKDVSVLAEMIEGKDITNSVELAQALAKYQRNCKSQSLLMSTMMDVFYQLFSNDNTILSNFRKLALTAANKAGPAKQWVLKRAVGY